MIKIEKGIPIPEYKREGGAHYKFPFGEMGIGDSFEIDVSNYKNKTSLNASLIAAWKRYCKEFKLDYKFRTFTTEKGVRIFRVE